MDGFKHSYRSAGPAPRAVDHARDPYRGAGPARRAADHARDRHARMDIDIGNVPGLRYSSPWPWALALAISLSIWASLAWLVRLSI